MLGRLKAWLLHVANSSPPFNRTAFYDFKQRLLERHGQFVGHDLQVITKECWGPYSRYGDDYFRGCTGKTCPKCGGTGIFDQRWIRLERWRWGKYVFHRPTGDTRQRPDSPPESWIQGRIEHPSYGRGADEARLWLYLLCGEWRLLWRDLRGHCYCRPGLFPMLRLQKVAMWLSMKLSRQTCYRCERRFFTWGSGWLICRRCRKAEAARRESVSEIENDEIPF